jgi:hypothetical protein
MRHALALFLVVLAAGCGSNHLARSAGGLEVGAAALELPLAFVGYTSGASLAVFNSSRGRRVAALEVSAPFTLDTDSLEASGGASVELPVHFFPTAEGPAEGTLRLTVGDEVLEVALRGHAQLAPNCQPSAACRASTFDPAQGTCVETVLPDDTSCAASNACLESARCVAGECLGTARSCDDGDRCTADSCDPTSGCVHFDGSASCPAPSDPCKAAFCDPASGCGQADAPDGTACGAADCTTAQVCLAGQCRQVAVPEGATCAPETPCQAKGICHAQVCARPAATVLAPAWSYTVPDGYQLYFNGLADAAGNLYWAECVHCADTADCAYSNRCALVSATQDGFVRYRVAIGGPAGDWLDLTEPGLLVLVDDNVVSALSASGVEARRTSDGALVWSADLVSRLPVTYDAQAGLTRFGPVVDDGHGGLFVRGRWTPMSRCGDAGSLDTLFTLSAATGAVSWQSDGSGRFSSLASDEAGNAYATASLDADAGTFSGLVSFTKAGAERWRSGTGLYGDALVVAGGRVVVADERGGAIYGTTAGDKVVPPLGPPPTPYQTYVTDLLLGPASAYVLGQDYCPLCALPGVPTPPSLTLHSVALADASPQWDVELNPLVGPMSSAPTPVLSRPALAQNGDLLFAQGPGPYSNPTVLESNRLRALTAAGAERFACKLPGPVAADTITYAGATALHAGRWVVAAQPNCFSCLVDPPPQLLAFDVPGYDLAQTGWVAPGGSNRRAGRPR